MDPRRFALWQGRHTIHTRRVLARRGTAVSALLIGLLAMAGCGDQSDQEQDFYVEPSTPENPVARTEAAAAEVAGREELPNSSALASVSGSGVSGGILSTRTSDGLTLVVEAEGLPSAEEYAAHIHRGVCAEGGPVLVALNSVVGLSDGTGASTTTLGSDEVSPNEPLFVQIHGTGGAPVACGDLVGEGS